MPFIHVSLTQKVSLKKKKELAAGIGKLIEIIPGKKFEKAMVRVDDGCLIYRGGETAECAYVETKLRRPNEIEKQTAYVEKMYELFNEILDLDIPQCYFSMVELDTWGSRGTLK